VKLDGLTVLVTGSNRGIGRAIAARLASEPLGLLLCGSRSPEDAEPLEAPSGGAAEVHTVGMDLSSRDSIERSCAELAELDRIDLLVNNAGQFVGGLLEEQDLDDVYSLFQVNLVALIQLTQAVLPGMLKRGHGKVVNNASIAGYANFPGVSTYSASKAGVVGFSEALRRELRGTGVEVMHLVTPGIETAMMDETKQAYAGRSNTGAWPLQSPEEWAEKVLKGIRDDDDVVGPGGRTALAKLASRGPAALLDFALDRGFSRERG
jgi:short-subunit dehydrogenase